MPEPSIGSDPGRVHGPLHTEVLGLRGAPSMLFVHPNPLDGTCWLFQMAHLSTWYRTVAVDLPGYGRSPTASGDVTMPDIAAAVWEAAERGSSGPAVLVGCSVGSVVVQHMYHLAPERTRAVVLSGDGYDPPKPYAPRRIAGYRASGLDYRRPYTYEVLSPAFRETELARWLADVVMERNRHADLDTIIAMFEALGAPDPPWLQRDLRAPVLILTGSEDRVHDTAFALRDQLPDGELETIEGAGHACHFEQPWEFNRRLIAFLTRRGLHPPDADPSR